MANARIIYINNLNSANEEMQKIGVDVGGLAWLVPKAIYITIKIDSITPYAASIIKQEMLSKGGDVAVNKGVVNASIEKTDILIMGTLNQYKKLIYKLGFQGPSIRKISYEIQRLLHIFEGDKKEYFECGKYKLPMGAKTYIMGILNVTPDSFSDGGIYHSVEVQINKALEMIKEGADIIDIGGESTRPGFSDVDADTEISRVLPVIERLSKEINVPISIDTSKALVAEKALLCGASIVNDIWGLARDPKMAEVVAKHNAGIRKECMAIDPGIGFGKTLDQNIEVMRRLKELTALDVPVLLGTSRKSMIGNILNLPVNERIEGTAATVTLGITNGAQIVRVHDVKEMTRVARMADVIVRN